ncbi:phosphodiesterase [Curtobacterium sp. Leaf261]|uniref:phosphodiesterase n=1 Tax=Curtobacterium sp. Leaf261 TaxID=1736311 RepID=UPI0006FB1F7A|nr:phosphodiesterase [Curtobacterium sp. Leaf261]KQO64845.1 3',5'-cyclic-nucleotide phosphodiesterase [Curtobacterium sp. Leaf261]
MDSRTAEHPRPNHFLLHLSDTHLIEADADLYGDVDSAARLQQIIAEIEASGARPEAMVVTGDIADKGERGAYDRIRRIVEPAAERIGAQVIWAMGNHDERGAFRERLFGLQATDRPVDFVYDVNGLRVITLDTTVPGHHYGEVTADQLDWLTEELSTFAPHGTILAMHHPPVPSVQDLAVLVELRGQQALAEAIEGSDIRGIIAGHLHYSTNAMFAGIPVSVASATCYTQDLNEFAGGTRGQDGAQAFNLVHVYGDTIVHSVVPIGHYATVGEEVPAGLVADRLAAAGVRIPDPLEPAPVTASIPVFDDEALAAEAERVRRRA